MCVCVCRMCVCACVCVCVTRSVVVKDGKLGGSVGGRPNACYASELVL